MSTKTYSNDLRERVVASVQSGLSIAEVACRFTISRRTVRRWWIQYQETGHVKPKWRGNYRLSKVNDEVLKQMIIENQNVTIKELAQKLGVSASTVWRHMKNIKIVYKKKTFHYRESDPTERASYLKEIEPLAKDLLVYMDESGMQERDAVRARGWGLRGKKLFDKKTGKRSPRTNVIAAYCEGNVLAPCVFHGTCNRDFFEEWVKDFLVPELKPGQLVVMDNAAFHKSEKVQEMITSAKCRLIYLPPYSPDLNPIEHFWANLKRYVQESREKYETLQDAMEDYLRRPEFCADSAA